MSSLQSAVKIDSESYITFTEFCKNTYSESHQKVDFFIINDTLKFKSYLIFIRKSFCNI